jgi:hypothetical protein
MGSYLIYGQMHLSRAFELQALQSFPVQMSPGQGAAAQPAGGTQAGGLVEVANASFEANVNNAMANDTTNIVFAKHKSNDRKRAIDFPPRSLWR